MDGILKDLLAVVGEDLQNEVVDNSIVSVAETAVKNAKKMFYLDEEIKYFANSNMMNEIITFINSFENPRKIIERIIITLGAIFIVPYAYTTVANISIETIRAIALTMPARSEIGDFTWVSASWATIVLSLYFWIKSLFFTLVIYKQGLEMIFLKLTLPFGCLGLLSSDGGISGAYISILVKNSATIIFQCLLFELAQQLAYSGGEIFLAIACIEIAWHGPHIMNAIIMGYSRSSPSTAALVRSGVQQGVSAVRGIQAIKSITKTVAK